MHAPPTERQQLSGPSSTYPLSEHSTAPPAWLHSLAAVQADPRARLPLVGGAAAPEQAPLTHCRPAQQPALLEQPPPAARQQLSAPSVGTPLSAQTTEPPAWLHSPVLLQAVPGDRLADPDVPPQTLLMQARPEQQLEPAIQAPPWLRQQFRAPSVEMPLSLQTTDPPAWLHWLVEVQLAPSGEVPGPALGARLPPQVPFWQAAEPQQ
ncbi:MAG: hypothetical protein H0V24_00040 [Chloroflexia bacterium]|nr:hypothetical protein [Chloroflexia bacterium]